MRNNRERAKELRKLEVELNKITFNQVCIGSILADTWARIYSDKFNFNIISAVLKVFKRHLKVHWREQKAEFSKKHILYFKSGEHHHHEKMLWSIIGEEQMKNSVIIIGAGENYDINKSRIVDRLAIFDLLTIWKFYFTQFIEINKLLKCYCFSFKIKLSIYLDLFIQLIKVQFWINYFEGNRETRLVGGDYDRGKDSAPLFAVAASLGINSFTLQHGVINPPYGYSPIVADKILVWGEMAKCQLIEMGEKENNIIPVGNPNLENIPLKGGVKKEILRKLQLPEGKNVVLAINPIRKEYNHQLISFLGKLRAIDSSFNYYVKLHPAQKTGDYLWVEQKFGIKLLPNPFPLDNFIPFVDILLTHNSGLASECLYYDIPIGIIDILPIDAGNGTELHKYYGVSILKAVNDFNNIVVNRKDLIRHNFLEAIGEKAIQNIIYYINETLSKKKAI